MLKSLFYGSVAQWQSSSLLSYWLRVRAPPLSSKLNSTGGGIKRVKALYMAVKTEGEPSMGKPELNHYTITNQFIEGSLSDWVKGFIEDRKAQGISQGTINIFYHYKLKLFFDYCELNNVYSVDQHACKKYLTIIIYK
jgi:hypothetical protein